MRGKRKRQELYMKASTMSKDVQDVRLDQGRLTLLEGARRTEIAGVVNGSRRGGCFMFSAMLSFAWHGLQ